MGIGCICCSLFCNCIRGPVCGIALYRSFVMDSRTNIGRVRGLGSAKHGGEHWLKQRLTAVGNMLLTTWFVLSLFMIPSFEHSALAQWLAQPLVAVPMILMIANIFSHVRLGLQVLIEDYVHDEGLKFAAMTLLSFYVIASAVFGIFVVAKLAFTGALA
jgi:succinate dehydrogenase / fumarate reductase membrane anchor subunit